MIWTEEIKKLCRFENIASVQNVCCYYLAENFPVNLHMCIFFLQNSFDKLDKHIKAIVIMLKGLDVKKEKQTKDNIYQECK